MFTTDALTWWPTESHSIRQQLSEIVFEPHVGGEVYEVSESGERLHWATVLEWEPPTRIVLAWNILRREGDVSEVEVRFSPEDDGTRVELEHRGWERVAESGAEKRGNYDAGWGVVLGKYAERVV